MKLTLFAIFLCSFSLWGCAQNNKVGGITVNPDTQEEVDDEVDEDPEPEPKKDENEVNLRQRAVARVLGFVDIEDKSVIVYQDAQSALYQKSEGDKSPAGALIPKLYHSPIFVANTPRFRRSVHINDIERLET